MGFICSGSRLPKTTILPREVRWVSAEARMLVQHHAVEAELVGEGQLIDVFLIEAARLIVVPQFIGHCHPTAMSRLVEIFVEIGISHEMPAEQLDGSHRLPRGRA